MLLRSLAVGAALGLVVLAGCTGKSSSANGPGKSTSVFKLKPGDCVVPPTDIKAEITAVNVVHCSTPHTQEVFANVTYVPSVPPGAVTSVTTKTDSYPGDTALRTAANGLCLQQYAAYVGVDYRDSTLFYTYLMPSARSWGNKDRSIVCILTTTGQTLTVSMKGSKR